MSWSFFVIGFFVVPNLLWWWWADRRVRPWRFVRVALAAFMVPVVFYVSWIATGMDSARAAHHVLPRWFMVIAFIWVLGALPLSLLAILFTWTGKRSVRRWRGDPPPDPDRRRFLRAALACTPPVAAGVAAIAALPTLEAFAVSRRAVAIPGLPRALDGMRLLHLSDLHYGKYTTAAGIRAVLERANAVEADFVCFTGDLVDLSLTDLDDAIEFLARLDRRRGLFCCEGNHDLIEDGVQFRAAMKRAGIPLLVDAQQTVRFRGERVQFLGAAWRRQTAETVAKAKSDALPILLAHHPHVFDEAAGVPLTLSGHTHGGQVMLNERLGAGPVLFRYWSGLYRQAQRSLVVSNGVGNWFPIRTHAPAEMTQITLRAVE